MSSIVPTLFFFLYLRGWHLPWPWTVQSTCGWKKFTIWQGISNHTGWRISWSRKIVSLYIKFVNIIFCTFSFRMIRIIINQCLLDWYRYYQTSEKKKVIQLSIFFVFWTFKNYRRRKDINSLIFIFFLFRRSAKRLKRLKNQKKHNQNEGGNSKEKPYTSHEKKSRQKRQYAGTEFIGKCVIIFD